MSITTAWPIVVSVHFNQYTHYFPSVKRLLKQKRRASLHMTRARHMNSLYDKPDVWRFIQSQRR